VGFRDGEETDCWGRVKPNGNGTSGVAVRDRVVKPLGTEVEAVWFTDAVDHFFVKRNGRTGKGRQ